MWEIIAAGILFGVAVFAFILSIRSFKEKGFLLNNAYLYASKQERESMDKRPYYRQSAVVFLLISIVFMLNGFETIFHTGWLSFIAITTIVITIIWAIVSSILIEKQKK